MTYNEHSHRVVQLVFPPKMVSGQVKARAEQHGSSSMVYLANTLRQVVKAAHYLMAAQATHSSGKGGESLRPAMVVEHHSISSGGDGTLRVRMAVAADGAVAP